MKGNFEEVSCEFRSKEETEVVVRTAASSEFHILGAATENARSPVDVLVLGMKRTEVWDDLVAEFNVSEV
jgi:hypothetical protein